jgi:hypothetical protein
MRQIKTQHRWIVNDSARDRRDRQTPSIRVSLPMRIRKQIGNHQGGARKNK